MMPIGQAMMKWRRGAIEGNAAKFAAPRLGRAEGKPARALANWILSAFSRVSRWGLACGLLCGLFGNLPRSAGQSSMETVPGPKSAPGQPLPSDVSQLSTPAAQSQNADPIARQLQGIVSQAIADLDPSRLPNVQQAKEQVESQLASLEVYLNPTSSNGQSWSKFLRLDAVRQELQAERPNLGNLVDLELNMRQNYPGLEYGPFTAFRQSLSAWIRGLRYGQSPQQTVEQLEQKLQLLWESLDEPVTSAGTDRNYAVGLMVNYLHEMNQVPSAVSQITQLFSSPNLHAYVRESFINRVIARPLSEPNPVNECILGTRVVGQACLNGNVAADLLPMVGGVALKLNLTGNISSISNGYNRGVVLGTSSFAPVHASKAIYVTPQGISTSPAMAAANLTSSINSIHHPMRLIRRIASRKAAEQKPLADAIAEGRLENRLRSQYEQQVELQLATARVSLASFQSQSPPELTRLGMDLPAYSFHSDDLQVYGQIKQAGPFQLAASANSGLPKPTSSDLVVEAHQSALVNALDIVLGDRTIRSADLDDYALQVAGKVPEEILQEANGEPWSVSLATYRPVEIEFDDSHIVIKLRITRMTRGSQALDDGAFVKAVYVPDFSQGVLTLTRQGEVELTFARASRGLRVVTLRSFLKGKFEAFFKEQFVSQRLDLASRFPNLPRLTFDSWKIDNGWLQVGLR